MMVVGYILYDISDMFFIGHFLKLIYLTFHSNKDYNEMVPNKTDSQYI